MPVDSPTQTVGSARLRFDGYAFALAVYVYASTPGMNPTLLTDSIRNGPAQLVHSMLTLAKITEGRATSLVGAGEVKQCNPFGWKRS